MAGTFKWNANEDGSITILDVEFASDIAANERPDFNLQADIDGAWYERAIELFKMRAAKRKYPRVYWNHGGEAIGTIDDIRYARPWAVCDMTITNPEAVEKIKRGELASRSMDFYPETDFIWGLSLLDGEGHFDEEMRDLILDETPVNKKAMDKETKGLIAGNRLRAAMTRSRALKLQEKRLMPLDEQTKQEIIGLVQQSVKAIMDEMKAKGAPDEEAAADAKAKEDAEKNAAATANEIAELKAKAATESLITEMVGAGVRVPVETLRKELSDLKTDEGRKQYCERVKAMPRDFDKEPDGVKGAGAPLNAMGLWRAAISELEKGGMSRHAAMVAVDKRNPELRQNMLKEAHTVTA